MPTYVHLVPPAHLCLTYSSRLLFFGRKQYKGEKEDVATTSSEASVVICLCLPTFYIQHRPSVLGAKLKKNGRLADTSMHFGWIS